jgi:hypothetical protein
LPKGVTPYEAWYGRPFSVWPEADIRRRALRAQGSPILGEEPALIEQTEESETSDSEQDEIPIGTEKLFLSEMSQRIAKFSVGVRERMILKKGGKGLQYRVGEIATLAISKKYRVGIEVGRVMVRILIKIRSVSTLSSTLIGSY